LPEGLSRGERERDEVGALTQFLWNKVLPNSVIENKEN
jgi:hypothetical protein